MLDRIARVEDRYVFEDKDAVEAAAEDAPKRAQPRDSMFLQATMRHLGRGAEVALRVRNLSPGGLMGECGGVFDRGDPVEVELRGVGPVEGRVAWRADERVGVAFDMPIDPKAARKPVGAAKPDTGWKRPTAPARRPGLRID